MPVFDSLERASFDGLEFPVRSVQIRGRYRHHTHEYLRVPGGVIEKLERGLYVIEMDALFHATIRGYGDLWPTALTALRQKFETGVTSTLVIPTIGSIRAFLTDWDQSADMGRIRSGESVRLPFLEDQTDLFLNAAAVQTNQNTMAAATERFRVTRADFAEPPSDRSLFDKIQDAANRVLAIKDQGELYGGLLSAKLAQMTALLDEADKQAESLKQPTNHELLDALLDLWDSAVNLATNLAESPRGPRLYTTPRQMTVSDVSSELYGGSERANELMLNNDLADPFAIPAGTSIVYFADEGTATGARDELSRSREARQPAF